MVGSDYIFRVYLMMMMMMMMLKSIEKWNEETETWSEVEEQLEEKRQGFGLVAAPKSLICTL